MTRARLLPVLVTGLLGLLLGLLLGGCASSTDKPGAAPSTPSGTGAPVARTTPAPAPDPAPATGSCHRLTLRAATRPTDDAKAVPCGSRHTAVTIEVGRTRPLVDGHLLAIDSNRVQDQLARECPRRLPAYLGGSTTDQRLSRFRVVWFGPTVQQADLGASWYRCDVVALDHGNALADLPRRLRGILDKPHALDTFGTCGTAAPDAKQFQTVSCARRHTWRAVDVIELGGHAKYLGKKADAAANDACKSQAQQRAHGALRYTWSFQWPTRDAWNAGRHYGFCWVPTT